MPPRRKVEFAPEAVTYDPAVGQYLDLSPAPRRSRAELATLRRITGLERPPTGLDTRPFLIDSLKSLLSESRGSGGGTGWGTSIVEHHQYVGRGASRRIKRTWRLPVGLAAVVLAIYELDRLSVGFANWWPGSKLAAPDWASFVNPAPIGQWLTQHLSFARASVNLQQTAAPIPQNNFAAVPQWVQDLLTFKNGSTYAFNGDGSITINGGSNATLATDGTGKYIFLAYSDPVRVAAFLTLGFRNTAVQSITVYPPFWTTTPPSTPTPPPSSGPGDRTQVPNADGTCNPGYTLMLKATRVLSARACVANWLVAAYQNDGWTVAP